MTNWRWMAWTGGIFLIALIALLPLRAVAGGLAERGFSARHIAGTIWYGRIDELMFKGRRVGTLDVQVEPLALLLGATRLRFSRIGDPDGELRGTLLLAGRQGVRGLSGRLAAAGMLGDLPLATFDFEELTLLFRGGRCVEAKGQIAVQSPLVVPGQPAPRLSGRLRCEGERVRARLSDPAGALSLEFYVGGNGRYRGWLTARGMAGDTIGQLEQAGFRPSATGMVLSTAGEW